MFSEIDKRFNEINQSFSGNQNSISLISKAYEFAKEVLAEGGIFIAKVFQGGAEGELLADAKKNFVKVTHFKPAASRKESPETYLVAQSYRKRDI